MSAEWVGAVCLHPKPQRVYLVCGVGRGGLSAVAVLDYPKKEKGCTFSGVALWGCVGAALVVYFVGVRPIATAFACMLSTVFATALCVTPRYVAMALYPYPL